jgi:hypothetical protein
MLDQEADIIYENGPFFIIKVKSRFEIRKNGNTFATLIGVVDNAAQAQRFVDRAVSHPDRF